MPPPGRIVNVRSLVTGDVHSMPESEALATVRAQPASWAIETPAETADASVRAQTARDYDNWIDKTKGVLGAAARGASVGASDVVARVVGGADTAEAMTHQREALGGWAPLIEGATAIAPVLATGGAAAPEVAGGLAARTGLRAAAEYLPSVAASRLGAGITRTIAPEGAGLGAKLLGGALGAGTETALYNVGAAASEAALSDDPLTVDHLKGAITTGYLLGAPLGAGASLLEHGLAAGSRRLGRLRDEAAAAPTIADDLATLDRKGLDVVKEAEDAAIEAGRVPQRAQLAADVQAFRDHVATTQPWVAVAEGGTLAEKQAAIKLSKKLKVAQSKAEADAAALEAKALAEESAAAAPDADMFSAGAAAHHRAAATAARDAADTALADAVAAEERASILRAKNPAWMGKGMARSVKTDMTLDRVLDDPKALAGLARPEDFGNSARAVQKALRKQEAAYEMVLSHEAELKAMHKADTSGQRAASLAAIPEALQRNRALQQQIDSLLAAPSTPRLAAINDAITSYADRAKLTTAQKIGAAVAGGTTMSAVYAVGSALPGVGFLAPLAGAAAASLAVNKIGRTIGKTTVASLERSKRAVDALMSGVRTVKRVIPPLASKVLAAGPFGHAPSGPRTGPATLQEHFADQSAQVAKLVAPGPGGTMKVRPEVRAAMGRRVAALAAHDPRAADALETHGVRRIEFLAGKMPKVTQIGTTRLMPPEGAIRAWARMVAAADNPGEIEERVAHGTVTREDREVMQALYPERYAAFVRKVVEHPQDVAKLPYQNRLALALFTGAPVDATLDPRILGALQGVYAREPGTDGGTQAPRPQPAFGSVKAPEATPAERRAG